MGAGKGSGRSYIVDVPDPFSRARTNAVWLGETTVYGKASLDLVTASINRLCSPTKSSDLHVAIIVTL